MPPLPRRLYLYIALTAITAAVVSDAIIVWSFGSEDLGELRMAVVLLLVFGAAARFPLHLAPRYQQELSPAPGIAAAMLLSPSLAIVVCALGQVSGELGRPRSRTAQAVFNTSVVAIQAGLAATVAGMIAERTDPNSALSGSATLALAGLAWFASGAILIEGIVALQLGKRFGANWWNRHRGTTAVEISLLLLGGFAALIVDVRPWVLPLMAVPVAVVYRAFSSQQITLRQAETSRERAEQAHRRLTTIVDATPDYVLTLDSASRVQYANPAARALLELPDEVELDDFPIEQVFAGWKASARAASTTGSWVGETDLITPAGPLPVSQVIVVHRNQSGGVDFISTIARDISERKAFEERLVQLADHDPLTGIFNRRRFEQEVDRHLAAARTRGSRGAVLYIDLDGFKGVNDTFGHRAGDLLLQGIAENLRRDVLTPTGALGRLGGDEFALVMDGVDGAEAQRTAVRALETIRNYRLNVEGRAVGLTGSVGVALYDASYHTRDAVLASADEAMYRAKEAGNRVAVAMPPSQRRSA